MNDIFVRTIGGLGLDQTWKIRAVLSQIPGVSAPPPVPPPQPIPENCYQLKFTGAILVAAPKKIAVIGHSLGCDTAIETANELARLGYPADYLCLIEPVWNEKKLPPLAHFASHDVFVADALIDFPRAMVIGADAQTIRHTDHNSICHSDELLIKIRERIAILQTYTNAETA